MPSAAGIIVATGLMTAANDALQSDPSATTVAERLNWKVIPATAVAAVVFYGLSQVNEPIARGLAWLTLFTAFIGGDKYVGNGNYRYQLSPFGTLLKTLGYTTNQPHLANGFTTDRGLPTLPYNP